MLYVILVIVVAGFAMWTIGQFVTDPKVSRALIAVIAILLVVYLLEVFGLLHGGRALR